VRRRAFITLLGGWTSVGTKKKENEDDTLFQGGIGQCQPPHDDLWGWSACGILVGEFCEDCRTIQKWLGIMLLPNGWVTCGPFPTRRAAERDLQKFARAYLEFARAKIPGLRIIPTSEHVGMTVSLFEPSPKRETLH
jgi:hypothetical protein